MYVVLKGGLLAKSRKLFFSGEVIFGGQNTKNAKKISKTFIVPNCLLNDKFWLGYFCHFLAFLCETNV